MPPHKTRSTGIRDVARRAGISVATASRVLSGSSYPVAEPTRRKVLEAAQALGFVPNAMARGLARARSDSIGVIIPIASAYYDGMITGIEATARRHGLTVLLGLTQGDEDRREILVGNFLERRVDGILVCAAARDIRPGRPPGQMPVPTVLVGQQPNAGYPMVRTDNIEAGFLAARHLWSKGHRRFAYLTPDESWHDFRDRHRGMMQFLETTGERFHVDLLDGIYGEEDAYERVGRLCVEGLSVTAILASTDRHALGTLAALADAGRAVPGDIAVMGFDNYLTSAYLRPSLTSMSMPASEMGRIGVEHLRQMLDGKEVAPDTVLSATLIERQSTAPASTPLR